MPRARQQLQPQRVQLDEALRVLLVVGAGVFLEGDMRLGIERVVGPAGDGAGGALVELHADGAGDMLLRFVDQGLQHLALGREPEAVVDQLRIARHDRP
jgi:hypothetical protein